MDVRRLRMVVLATGIAMATAVAAPAAAPAAGLIAAYDRYETGKGFEIGLANASTGARLTLPAGVNTTDDELHPSLSIDGRYLTWMRTRLLPKLNGDIVPPAERTLFMLDRQTGTITTLNTGTGAPAVVRTGLSKRQARGLLQRLRAEGWQVRGVREAFG